MYCRTPGLEGQLEDLVCSLGYCNYLYIFVRDSHSSVASANSKGMTESTLQDARARSLGAQVDIEPLPDFPINARIKLGKAWRGEDVILASRGLGNQVRFPFFIPFFG